MTDKRGTRTLVAQQDAILDYLDALLREIPDEYPEEESAPAPARVGQAKDEIQEWNPQALAVIQSVAAKPVVAEPVVAEPVVAEPVAAEPVAAEPVAAEPVAAEPVAVAAIAGPPEWAEPEFQALLFQVGALQLAVPLVKLHSVVPWTEKVTPMPRQPDWCHGLLRYRDRNVKVVDTAELVLPPDKRGQAQDAKHILVLGDGGWGLSCSAIGKVIRLRPDEVKWRGAAGQRPWLAGTVLAHLCALLDCEALAGMLADTGL